ncbi:MAG: amidase family protein [archaeon]
MSGLKKHVLRVNSGQIDAASYVNDAVKRCEEINKEYGYFNTICTDAGFSKKGKLAGVLVSVKDNICVKGVESTAGSRMLKGYRPLFDATAVGRLKSEGAVILGKTSCDAFGFGSFNTNVGIGFDVPKNPFDKKRATGGSSGGGAGITAKADFVHVAIVESTGGSIENPASFCGVVGFCPTYGRVSRNGLISYANSLDKIGIMTKSVADIAPVLEVISGFDPRDATSLQGEIDLDYRGDLRVGIVGQSASVDPLVSRCVQRAAARFGADEVSMPLADKFGIAAYYIISTCEASTNLACLSGLRYGQDGEMKGRSFSDYFSDVRSRNFNEESKRRIMLGTFARMAGHRDAYYIKASKIRTLIIEEYRKLFETYDILISPTMPDVAPRFSDIEKMTPLENYMMDVFTVGPNLAGIPHASIPVGMKKGMPVGMMAMANHNEEGKLLKFLSSVENEVCI